MREVERGAPVIIFDNENNVSIMAERLEQLGADPEQLQHVLFSLGYTDDLADEAEITAAVEVARSDWPQWRAA